MVRSKIFALSVCALTACATDEPDAEISWHRDLRPIVDRRCLSCHATPPPGEDAVAPFVLDDPAVVESLAPAIAATVADRTMPPWSFDPSCREPVGSMWLSDEELAAFAAWEEAGFPMGDEADYAPAERPEPLDPGPPDLVLGPGVAYTPSTEPVDDYRCFVVPERFEEETYIRGVRAVPQNLAVAHHVIVYVVTEADRGRLAELEAEDSEPGYACFGTPRVDTPITIGGWAPGDGGRFLPEDTAIRVPRGSQLVIEMHYNTSAISAAGETPEPDLTRAELWTLPEGEVPGQVVVAFPVAKLGLSVPPNEPHSEQLTTMRIPIDGKILTSTPHMHTRGVSLRSELVRADGSRRCLTDLRRWDFDWQRSYGIPQPDWIPVTIHDEVEITCTYDNSGNDQPLSWGENTSDEMCLDFLGIVVPWDGGVSGGTCSGFPSCNERCAPDDPFCSLACMTASSDACLYCGTDLLFGDCLGLQCPAQGLALLGCMEGCAFEYEHSMGCLYEECRAQFDAYWTCAQPLLQAGAPGCEAELAACPEIVQ